MDRLPPLSSLRAFEAVARRLSFSRAAEDLHVTPGAVSQQIRFLEQHLGETLFDRTRRSVALTETAMRMLPEIQAGLETLSRALASRSAPHSAKALTISVAPSFASKWLLPRLADFSDQQQGNSAFHQCFEISKNRLRREPFLQQCFGVDA